jgi:hypothetical protein
MYFPTRASTLKIAFLSVSATRSHKKYRHYHHKNKFVFRGKNVSQKE